MQTTPTAVLKIYEIDYILNIPFILFWNPFIPEILTL